MAHHIELRDFTEETVPALNIEPCEDGTLLLEQDWSGEVERVAVHPVHLRLMAEKLGMVPALTAQDIERAHMAETWKRRLLVLASRVAKLDDLLRADSGEDDPLNVYSAATRELAAEFCADFNAGAA